MPKPNYSDPDAALMHFRNVAVGQSGFSSWLGIEPVRVWEGEAELILAIRRELTQHHGYAHGAIVGVMADNACAWAASSIGGDVVMGSYTINFLAPAIGSQLRAKAVVVRAGKRQIVATGQVWSENCDQAKLVAIAQATVVPVN